MAVQCGHLGLPHLADIDHDVRRERAGALEGIPHRDGHRHTIQMTNARKIVGHGGEVQGINDQLCCSPMIRVIVPEARGNHQIRHHLTDQAHDPGTGF